MDQKNFPKRLEIFMAELPQVGGSIQFGVRPVLVIQNDVGNENSSTVIVVPLTSKTKKKMPTHVILPPSATGLPRSSVALCEQILTVPMDILERKAGALTDEEWIERLHTAIRVSVGV